MRKQGGRAVNSRDKIMRCAQDLFHRIGYQATSVDIILRECGVAKSNFYYHFESKDALALAVLDLQATEYEMLVEVILCNIELTPIDRLQRFGEELGTAHEEKGALAGCPFGNFAAALSADAEDTRGEMFRERLCQFFDRLEHMLIACLREGVALGQFRSDVTQEDLARFLLASVEGYLLFAKTRRDVALLRHGCEVAIRLLQDR